MNTIEFDEIRPYHDEELPQIYEELIADEAFQNVVSVVMPDVPFEVVAQKMRSCKTKLDFQKTFCYSLLHDIAAKNTTGLSLDISDENSPSQAYTYISNHRDIILDSGFLSVLLVEKGLDTVEIAIGDNLLIYPWISKLVRINKSFIVQRGLSLRQMLQSSARMSKYMHYAINEKKESIWIAQREGRAKDSDDRTQDSILKMFAMGGEGDIITRLVHLNIAPLSISYEYDPCDFLKAQEYQMKRDIDGYKKTTTDDLVNMQTGLFGYKGEVHFQVAPCINNQLQELDPNLPKTEFFSTISAIIDKAIHANYRIYKSNYIAYDLLYHKSDFISEYSDEEKEHFENYIASQLQKIIIPNKDLVFLREKMLIMYANPLVNHLAALR